MARPRPHVTAERQLDAALLSFDLPSLVAGIKMEDTWRRESHTAMTLVKSHGLRLVLVAMHGGTRIPPHRADGAIGFQVLEGTLTVNTETQLVTLSPGQLLTLHSGVYHVVEAPWECAFLLTLSADPPHPVESRRVPPRAPVAPVARPSLQPIANDRPRAGYTLVMLQRAARKCRDFVKRRRFGMRRVRRSTAEREVRRSN